MIQRRRVIVNFAVLTSLLCMFLLPGVWAQEQSENDENCISGSGLSLTDSGCLSSADVLGKLDLAVPDNSLFAVMGATPETIIRPKVGDKFAASVLPQVADAFGNEQYAVGFEVNPGLALMPSRYTQSELLGIEGRAQGSAERVRRLKTARALSNFTFTGAATRSTDNGTKSTYGLGINYNFDSGAPFNAQRKYARCLTNAIGGSSPDQAGEYRLNIRNAIRLELIAEGKEPTFTEIEDALEARLAEDETYHKLLELEAAQGSNCVLEVRPWNRNTYGAGVAVYQSEVSPEAAEGVAVEDTSETGVGLWASASLKAGQNGQFTVGAKWSENAVRQREQEGEKITETVDGWQIGSRYVHNISEEKNSDGATTRSVRGFVEVAYAEESFGDIEDSFTQAGIGFEVQLQKNLFFQASFGDTFDSEIDRGTYLTGQFKWAFSQNPAS